MIRIVKVIILLSFISSELLGQNQIIGRVIDFDTKKSIKDVIVSVKSKNLETIINSLGYFQILADTSDYLIFEKPFYQSGQVKVLPSYNMKVALKKRNEAVYEGGMEVFYGLVAQNIRYPQQAVENKTMGKIIISFVIDSTGQMKEIKKVKDIGNDCGDDLIRILKNIPNKWLPAETATTFILPVIFKFENYKFKFNEAELPHGKILQEIVVTKLEGFN